MEDPNKEIEIDRLFTELWRLLHGIVHKKQGDQLVKRAVTVNCVES